eukprot:TRINITY_DN143_c0_g1_i1.p1 TRINITY_DN143_c0_g1~~TRINITY_DN143_c0_g1_i1.p1  ORF type:complete len:588 (-),score=186.44 TRINITY_DN143_c0_g1_i1:67-1830(-)
MEQINRYFSGGLVERKQLLSSLNERDLHLMVKKVVADHLTPNSPPPSLELISELFQCTLDRLKSLHQTENLIPTAYTTKKDSKDKDDDERARYIYEEVLELILEKILDPKFVGQQTISFTTELSRFILKKHHLTLVTRSSRKNLNFIGDCLNSGQQLGKGSFGVVYRGYNITNGVPVAIKVIDWKFIISDPLIMKTVRMEIETMTKLSHKNIVKLYNTMEQKDFIYLIMELCDGGTLADFIKKVTMDQSVIFHVMTEIADGLKYLRQEKVIHRDLKPANILLSNNDNKPPIKLADFSFARFLDAGDQAATYCGTKLYMAPEIYKRALYTDNCDIWSLGIIFYEMVYRTKPFPARTEVELAHMLQTKEVEYPPCPNLSPNGLNLLKMMLVKDPALRIGWDQFFAHPYFQSPPVVAAPTLHGVVPANQLDRLPQVILNLQKRTAELEIHLKNQKDENQKDRVELIQSYERKLNLLKEQQEKKQEADSRLQELQLQVQELKKERERDIFEKKEKDEVILKLVQEKEGAMSEVERLKEDLSTLDAKNKKLQEEKDEKAAMLSKALEDAVNLCYEISTLKTQLLEIEAKERK